MIRVNLLPRRVTRRKLTVIRHMVIGLLLIIVLVIGIFYLWMFLSGKIDTLKSQVAQAQEEKEKLKNVHKEKEKHEKNIQDLKQRIEVISQIQEGRNTPIHLFDEVTKVLNEDLPVWLTNFSFNGDNIQIDGYSFTNPDIAKMVKELEKSLFIKNVELLFSQKATVQQREIFKFSILASLESEEKEEE